MLLRALLDKGTELIVNGAPGLWRGISVNNLDLREVPLSCMKGQIC